MENKITQWSFSRFALYESCPFKAKLKYIDKLEEPTSPPLERGTRIHQLAEQFIKGELKDFPEELKLHEKLIRSLQESYAKAETSKVIVEEEWAFTKEWESTGWFDENAWVRIKLDCIQIVGDHAYVIDWKTGKFNKNLHKQYERQLHLYALATFLKFPGLAVVTPRLYYLDTGDVYPKIESGNFDKTEPCDYTRDQVEELKLYWELKTKPLLTDNIFAPRPSWLCRYCHFRKGNGGPCKY